MSDNSTIQIENNSSVSKTTETTQDDQTFNNFYSNSLIKNLDSTPKKQEKIFIYTTPEIKIKKELVMPSTPHKIKKEFNSNEFLEKGRNLLELFEAL